ncbi:MAG: LamG-like jellyroll fold domain-containing protein [Patescibacteria group bacterium]|nr:LamG-like jellyroll fold domain-containing protein [Patescibacteria group bacterium]
MMNRPYRICSSTALAAVLAIAATCSAAEPVQPITIDKPLVAYWTCDDGENSVLRDIGGREYHAATQGGVNHTAGVFGRAVRFSGQHMAAVQGAGRPDFSTIEQISFSAWVQVDKFDRYNEIFRKEDGNDRVLFSFQEDGTVLALGLNVGGYVECDARIDPKAIVGAGWRHYAATFDGMAMRVYLDGAEIGILNRPGKITAGGAAPGCIGSTNGRECLQGTMDDLRIYSVALTAAEVAQLYANGIEAITMADKHVAEHLAKVYQRGDDFAETLANVRRNLAETKITPSPKLVQVLQARLSADFAEPLAQFIEYTERPLADHLSAQGNTLQLPAAERLIGMLLEYKPITEHQWAKQTPDQIEQWKDDDAIAARMEALKAQGDAALYSPEWVRVMLVAGDRIDFRPRIHEAVAPYVTPSTPETRNLTDEEARAAIELDWLHQAGQETAAMRVQGGRTWYSNAPVSTASPTPERIREEIVRTRKLAARIASHHPDRVTFAEELAKLGELEQKAAGLTEGDRELYFQIRQIKRDIMFRNPVIDFDQLLFIDKPYPQGREWQHETRHRLGYQAVPGGRLLVLEGLGPGGHLRQLMPQSPLHGSFWRPDLSFDGTKIVFCYKPHNEKAYHLYEIGVDGSGLRQLTDGIYDDFDPIYLPDGHIMFSTTRGHTYVRCMPPTNAFVLARCDADGKNIYLVSRNNEPDYLPSVMNDGRVIYTRWEYTDKPLWRAQGLWTVNPDGTYVQAFWGNQTVWPDLLKDARAIPGSRRVMFTGSAHHNWFAGTVGIIDPGKGYNFPDGLTKVTAELAYPESGNGPVDPIESPDYRASGAYSAYYSPYPLSEEDFLVSANRGGKFVLYLMDTDGNRELLYEGTHNIFYAMPLRPRPVPPVIADRVAWPSREERNSPKPGVIYSANVYYGAPPEIRDKARYLRVLNIEHKTYTYWHRRPYLSTGPVVSAVQSEGVKHIFGTVPIEKDGSVAFEAPAGFPLHFQLLDEEYRALQTMRSFTGVMPGERRGCLGCHESHSRAPSIEAQPTLALRDEPRTIDPPPWGDASVSFPRFVQPVLDQYCGKCHQGDGEGRKVVDFTDRPGFLIFSEPYLLLTGRPAWGRPYELPENPPPGFGIADILHVEGYDQLDPVAYQTPAPMTALSYRSRLIDIASSGKHHDVKVDSLSLQKLIAWVDTMAPYRGSEEVRELDDPEFQGIDWLSIRPRVKTAPIIVRPGPVD